MDTNNEVNFLNDIYNLKRFYNEQESLYSRVTEELKNKKKESHWMWFIFPQIIGLGLSETTIFFAIKSMDEAYAYLSHPILGKRLIECTELVYSIDNKKIEDIFESPDDLKLRSSMTLFSSLNNTHPIFYKTIEKFFDRNYDPKTMNILKGMKNNA